MPLQEMNDLNLHTIKTKLFPNRFGEKAGKYYARTVNEKTLGIEDLVNDMKNFGGYSGSKEEALNAVRSFIRTRNFRLADGFAVTDGYFTTYPHITGTFDSPNDPVSSEKNRVEFKHVNRSAARELAGEIKVEIQEIAGKKGSIFYLDDAEEMDALRNLYLPRNMVVIYGEKIKIAGSGPENGVYFVPVDETKPPVKMIRIAQNLPGLILGIAPDPDCLNCTIEVRTQFAGGSILLKEPRVIKGEFTIEML